MVPFLLILLILAQDGGPRAPSTREAARSLMRRLEGGDAVAPPPELGSGWIMTNEKGAMFQRSFLMAQAGPLIALGPEAVPELLRWLENREMQIRYVAHVALEKITGLEPWFPHFATLEQLRSKGWLENSRNTWKDWYFRRRNVREF